MLTGEAPVMKLGQQGDAWRALGFGHVAVALGACLLPDMSSAAAVLCHMGSLGVRGTGSRRRRFAGPKCV
jgi:hypothetical protein